MKVYSEFDFLDFNGDFKFDNFLCVLAEEIEKAHSKYYDLLTDINICEINISDFSCFFVPLHFLENLRSNLINCSTMYELDTLLFYSHCFLIDTYSFDDFNIYKCKEFEEFYFSFLKTLSNFDLKKAKKILINHIEYFNENY